jgi:two-component system, sensor histidine kinase and response regulator
MQKIILIVDDNPDIRYVIKIGMEEFDDNINIIEIENGEKCIEYLETNSPPDLILLDIMMPGLDGWGVASKIKKNPLWDHIPIFFLTAKIDSYSKSFGKIVCDKYIKKPFDLNELRESIKEVLG